MRCRFLSLAVVFVALLSAPSRARAGMVIASGDEWVVSNNAFIGNNAATTAFVTNLDNFIGGSKYLVYASNGTPYGSSFINTMTGLGNIMTTVSGATLFSTINLAPYDAVFIAGATNGAHAPAGVTQLNNYVSSGKAVYLSLGTGGAFGSAAGEAASWNPFLNTWGLTAGNTYFQAQQVVNVPTVSGSHALRQGVNLITWGFGQSISEINPANPNTDIAITGIFGPNDNRPLIGVYSDVSAVPEPSSVLLSGFGAVLAVFMRRRRPGALGQLT